ncbi:hypothetical protein [Flagellimonas crocea]|uniref:hypothetical protein n=1 Tax=Flagellimonas crocea TaxID=3067311 RepID=UPI00296FBE0C|nr:hypothetical protein [Muricauda sp. DH64]
MSIKLDEKQKRMMLETFLSNPTFYKVGEFKEVRKVILENYSDDFEILEKISRTKTTRELLASPAWLKQVISTITQEKFQFGDKTLEEGLQCFYKELVKYEEKFFNNSIYLESIDLLNRSIHVLNEKINSSKKSGEKDLGIDSLYTYFKKVVIKVRIDQNHQNKYQQLFVQVKKVFGYGGYINSELWFKFFFLFKDKGKFQNNIEQEVLNGTINYIRNFSNARIILASIEGVMPVTEFFSQETKYSNQIYTKASADFHFAENFYPYFSVERKKSLLEIWLKKSLVNFNTLIKKFEDDVPDRLDLAKSIVSQLRVQNTAKAKREFFDSLFNIGLSEKEINSTTYSDQVISLICHSNVDYHNLGYQQYSERKKYIDLEKLKEKAFKFLISTIPNLNSHHIIFKNLLELKIGIDKRNFDKRISETPNSITQIENYLVNSGNAEFYKVLTSKLLDKTIGIIGDKVLSRVNEKNKYESLLKAIKTNRKFLKEESKDKLDLLMG